MNDKPVRVAVSKKYCKKMKRRQKIAKARPSVRLAGSSNFQIDGRSPGKSCAMLKSVCRTVNKFAHDGSVKIRLT